MMATGPGVTGPINLGNPNEFTMIQLAELVKQLTGSKSKIVHEPLPADDPKQRQPNIAAAREILRWQPTVALKDGLVKTIAYFDELLGATDAESRRLVAFG
jgi:UDP-glucuronate decarboxylase